MAFRLTVAALTLALGLVPSVASAQTAATGTLVGRVVRCGFLPRALGIADRNPGPIIEAPPGPDDRLPPPVRRPAADVEVSLASTGLATRTDASGAFTLAGVPAAQPLTLLVQFAASAPPLVLDMPNLSVGAGQTLDLGAFGPAACSPGDAALVPQVPVIIPMPPAEVSVPPAEAPQAAPSDEAPDEPDPATDAP
jgi:hypothetical protein